MTNWLGRHVPTSRPVSIPQDPRSQEEEDRHEGQEAMVKNGEVETQLPGHVFSESDQFY